MTKRITFDRLLAIYRQTKFGESISDIEVSGSLLIADEEILETLRIIISDDDAHDHSGIAIQAEDSELVLGSSISVEISPPRLGLGLFTLNLDGLLCNPRARVEEPKHFFVVKGQYDHTTSPPPEELESYRGILRILKILTEAAAFLDKEMQELIFIKGGKFTIPIIFRVEHVHTVDSNDIYNFESIFLSEIHREQKFGILSESIVELTYSIPKEKRFAALLTDLPALSRKVSDGYRLFASSFSYEKIRGEMEAAQVEYVNRMHKTFSDIQAQVLGIPVATVIVATQFSVATTCEKGFFGNISILFGVWIFAILLLSVLINQYLTLETINSDIKRQKQKMHKHYYDIEDRFIDIFSTLGVRIWCHRIALIFIAFIAIIGVIIAQISYQSLTQVDSFKCLGGAFDSSANGATPQDGVSLKP